jgi:hypothetical protein
MTRARGRAGAGALRAGLVWLLAPATASAHHPPEDGGSSWRLVLWLVVTLLLVAVCLVLAIRGK